MSLVASIRTVLMILLSLAGLLQLLRLFYRRQSPAEMRGRLLAALALMLFAAALWAQSARAVVLGITAAGLGAACTLYCIHQIYVQSLHNTTM